MHYRAKPPFTGCLELCAKGESYRGLTAFVGEDGQVVVSEVRRRVCTHTLAFEGDGQVTFFDGTWSEYERHLRLSAEAEGEEAAGGSGGGKRFRPLAYY